MDSADPLDCGEMQGLGQFTFEILYCFIVLLHDRRQVVHFNVTAHPLLSGRLARSPKPSLKIERPAISCAIVIRFMDKNLAVA
jgi:hypothetical protein